MSSLSLDDLSRYFGGDMLYKNHNLVKEIINMLLLRIKKQVVIVEGEALYFYGERSAERVFVPLDEQSLSMCAGLFDQDQHVNEVEAFSNIKYRDINRIYYHFPVVMIIAKCIAASRRGAAYMIELGRIPDKYEVTIERESLSAFFEGNGLPHLSALYPEEKCSSDMIHGIIKDDPWISDISINIVREKMVSLNIEMPSSYTDEPKPVTGALGYSPLPRSDNEYEFYLMGDIWNIRYKDEFSTISSRS